VYHYIDRIRKESYIDPTPPHCRRNRGVYNGWIDCIALRPNPVYIGVYDLEGKPPTVW